MGHTLVAVFDEHGESILSKMKSSISDSHSKIPYGRGCDRYEADKILPYHMTVTSWSREYDSENIEKMNKFIFIPFEIQVNGLSYFTDFSEVKNTGLYFTVKTDANYRKIKQQLDEQLMLRTRSFEHITIAVSQDENKIERIKKTIEENITFPFTLKVNSLELYHIWTDIRRVKVYR